jgi:hypothetical protein
MQADFSLPLVTRPSGKGELVDIISPAVADPFRDSDFFRRYFSTSPFGGRSSFFGDHESSWVFRKATRA